MEDDIRKSPLVRPSELEYAKAHSLPLLPGQVIRTESVHYGASSSSSSLTLYDRIACAVIVGGIAVMCCMFIAVMMDKKRQRNERQ